MKPVEINFTFERKGIPKWASRAFVENDTVYLPAAMLGDERVIFFCLSHDCQSVITSRDNHIYAPVKWLIKEAKSEMKETLRRCESKVLTAYFNEYGYR